MNLRSRAAVAVLERGGLQSMLANVARTEQYTRPRRSAHAAVLETSPWHMPLATATSARGASATVRTNTLAAGWGDSLSKDDWEVWGRELALLNRPPLPLLPLEKAHISPKGSFPEHTARVITCIWDHTWTATPSELFGISTQVISRKLLDHDSAYWLES